MHSADSLHLVPFIGFPFLCKVRFVSVGNVKKCRKRRKLSKTVEHVENRRIRQTRETGIIEESQLLMSQMEANLKILGRPHF